MSFYVFAASHAKALDFMERRCREIVVGGDSLGGGSEVFDDGITAVLH